MKRLQGTIFAAVAAASSWVAPPALAQAPDLILRNGSLITMDPGKPAAEALAIAGERIVAVGTNAEVVALAGGGTRIVDLGGRTVIPGLNDTHIHAIRGGQSFRFESYWYDAESIGEALGILQSAGADREAGEWVAVVGSWHPEQFAEKRAPSVAELSAVLPDRPAYVQYLYDYAIVNEKGIEVLGLDEPSARPARGITVERNDDGRATGKLFGDIGSFNTLFAGISPSEDAQKKASLRKFFSALNSVGVTGFIDPSAGPAYVYEPLFALRDEGELTIRAGYRISASRPHREVEWFRDVMSFRPSRHSDGLVNFLGIGENLVFGMNDAVRMGPGFDPSPEARKELVKVAEFAAERRIPVEIHAYTDDAARAILDAFEVVAKKQSIADLRWSIAHLNTGSEETLDRMKALGLAYAVQMGPYFEADAILKANGAEASKLSPPVRQALDKGIMVVGGTDSTRIGIFGVWQAIEYHLTGESLGGTVLRPADQLLTREEALRLYTANATWIAFEENERGSLSPGRLADLAVLDKPYLTIPVEEVDTIGSVFTLLGGEIVHDAGILR